jgi:hypothetical protein
MFGDLYYLPYEHICIDSWRFLRLKLYSLMFRKMIFLAFMRRHVGMTVVYQGLLNDEWKQMDNASTNLNEITIDERNTLCYISGNLPKKV